MLVEKPLTANIAEAEELVTLAKEQQRILMVGHTFEYSPAVNELRRLVRGGDLDKIYCIEAERLNLGLFRSDINVIWDLVRMLEAAQDALRLQERQSATVSSGRAG